MSGTDERGIVVWQRDIDHEAGARRWRRFLLWYVAPVVVIMIIVAVAVGIGEALGVLILAGLFGLMLAGWIFFVTLNDRSGAEIRLVDGELVFGNKRVPVAEVECWSTRRSSMVSVHTAMGRKGNFEAVAMFRFPMMDGGRRGVRMDGGEAYSAKTFGWATMGQDEIEGVRAALTPHIPAPWVTPEELQA